MKKQITEKIEIPEGINVEIVGDEVIISGKHGSNKKKFNFGSWKVEKKGKEIILHKDKVSKKEKMQAYTSIAHIKNMIKGVEDKFEYDLKICFVHFPITVEIKGKEAVIKNFLGEKVPRYAKIIDGVDVKVDKDMIKVSSSDIEAAGQTAANLEIATRIAKRDRRVFQDGIFITSKCGEPI